MSLTSPQLLSQENSKVSEKNCESHCGRWWEQVGSALVWDFAPTLGTYMVSCISPGPLLLHL